MAAAASAKVAEKNGSVKDAESEDLRWQPFLELPCRLTIDLSVPALTVGIFLGLRPGSIVGAQWGVARDVPVRVNGILIGWGEMEGAGNRMAVRLTELA